MTEKSTSPAEEIMAKARAAQELAEKATPGPWDAYSRDVSGKIDSDELSGLGWEIDGPAEPWLRGQFAHGLDAIFIAQSRTLVPLLARQVEVLAEGLNCEVVIERAYELLRAPWVFDRVRVVYVCPECGHETPVAEIDAAISGDGPTDATD